MVGLPRSAVSHWQHTTSTRAFSFRISGAPRTVGPFRDKAPNAETPFGLDHSNFSLFSAVFYPGTDVPELNTPSLRVKYLNYQDLGQWRLVGSGS
jgi:hypothetical protein